MLGIFMISLLLFLARKVRLAKAGKQDLNDASTVGGKSTENVSMPKSVDDNNTEVSFIVTK